MTTLETARDAARTFLESRDFPSELLVRLTTDPVLGPVTLMRDDVQVTAYRWLGAGRGEDYIQVEVGPAQITVRGARGDRELPELTLPTG